MQTRALLAGGILLLCSAAQSSAQSVISGWDFQNLPVAADSTPASDLGTVAGAASTLGMTNSYPTPGPSMDISDVLVSATTGGPDPATTNNEWRVRGGEVTGGTAAGNGWSSLAPIGTQGAQFLVNTTGFTGVQVVFSVESTSTKAEANLELEYTLDGSTWINAPITYSGVGGTIETNSTSANTVMGTYMQLNYTGSPWAANITASITGAGNDPNFGVRMVNASTGADDLNQAAAAYNNSSGNWRFDEVQISGVSAVPEPGTTALLLGLSNLGIVLVVRQRRSKTV
jgi:hypothetical protein